MTTKISGSGFDELDIGQISLSTPLSVTDGGTGTLVAMSVYQSVAQSLPNGVATKLQFQTKEFDTTNAFDNVTNYRFQPTVAGYYQIWGGFLVTTSITTMSLYLYKNGIQYKYIDYDSTSAPGLYGSLLVYLNGSTDYIELFAIQGTTAQNTVANAISTYFQAILVRAI